MQNITKKFTILFSALLCSILIFAQNNSVVNCDVPSTFLVGEYIIEDNVATVGPNSGSSNFESGTYEVIANGNIRSFQISLLPGFTPSDFIVELNLDCGIIQITDIDTDLSCSINTLIFASTDDGGATTYDLNDDGSFIINYIEDPLNSCAGPYESSFRMTKVCNPPENITFPNFTASTINMEWTDTNDTTNTNNSYTVEYGVQGFSLGNGQTINDISGNNTSIDNLQIDTMYDFYIWTECSDTNSSEVFGPFSHGTFINPVFEVDTNGITCLCEDANIGDSGTVTINGEQKTFTKRNRLQLEALIANDNNDPAIALTCTSAIEDMSYLFYKEFNIDPPFSEFNMNIESWDVSNVNDMSHMFENARSFNQPLGNWDVSNVIDMSYMFSSALDFNQNINSWDVSSVTDMSYMFHMYYSSSPFWCCANRSVFNSPLNNWDVSSVTNMSYMFDHAITFNQLINNWDVSSVTDMSYMFQRTYDFNQALNNWDVANVTNMRSMFNRNSSFNQPLNDWDVSSVTNMFDLFTYTIYNQPLDNWDVSSVIRMDNMFYRNAVFNQPINSWDVSSVAYTTGMFSEAISFNQPLNDWEITSLQICWGMFYRAYAFNQPLSNWDTSNVGNLRAMFLYATSFNQSIDNWDLSSAAHLDAMFKGAISYNQPMNNIQFSNLTNMPSMFEGAISFNQPLNNWDVSTVEEMDLMFKDATSFNQDLSTWCVEGLPNEPTEFSLNSPLQDDYKPNWGEACTLSISENELEFFSVYPNPVRDVIYIKTKVNVGKLNASILDISGKIIFSQNVDDLTTTEIDLEELNSGFYFIKVSNANYLQIERFIKE